MTVLKKYITLIASLAGVLIALVPFAVSGFFFDDVYNSVSSGEVIALGISKFDFVLGMLKHWTFEVGRFFPVSVLVGYTSWIWADTLFKSKLIQLGLAVINVVLFYLVIARVSKNNRMPVISVLMLAATIQFNPRWDGLSSFAPLNQLVLVFILGAWLSMLAGLSAANLSAGRSLRIVSIGLCLLALLTYEVGVIALLGCLFYSWSCRKKHQVMLRGYVTWLLIAAGIFLTAYCGFRLAAQSSYDGVQIGSLVGTWGTFWAQFSSAFPLAFLNNTVIVVTTPSSFAWISLTLVFYTLWWVVIRNHGVSETTPIAEDRKNQRLTLLGMAMLLVCMPALIIAVSSKYQQIVRDHVQNPTPITSIEARKLPALTA